MNKIKNFYFALIVLLPISISGNLIAQQGPGPGRTFSEDDIIERVERLAETLEMTEKQEAQILKIELDEFNKRQNMRGQFQGDREAMRAYMQEARAKKDKKYAEILTEEQMTKWIELREQRRQKHQQQQKNNSDTTRKNRGRSR